MDADIWLRTDNPSHVSARLAAGHSTQAGLGLVEVIVALLVLATGVLGLLGTQLKAKQANYEAIQRSTATNLANDILERMRGNPGELHSYGVQELGSAPLIAAIQCNTAACSASDLAAFDLYEWSRLLEGVSEEITVAGITSFAGGLVDSRACIDASNGSVSVAIAWRGVSDSVNPGGSSCGQSSGLYGAANERRRLLVVKSFVGVL